MNTCRRGCCWTPYGHSAIRDNTPIASKRCMCHSSSAVTGGRPAGSVGEVREKTKGGWPGGTDNQPPDTDLEGNVR